MWIPITEQPLSSQKLMQVGAATERQTFKAQNPCVQFG